jgi:hypothetical protein
MKVEEEERRTEMEMERKSEFENTNKSEKDTVADNSMVFGSHDVSRNDSLNQRFHSDEKNVAFIVNIDKDNI